MYGNFRVPALNVSCDDILDWCTSHRFIPNGATILHPLHALLKQTQKPTDEPAWTEDTIVAFNNVKHALANATLLVHPAPNAPTSIMTDASDVVVGGILQQYINGQWCPLSFFSKTLQPAETCYSTCDRELMVIYLAIRHFRYFLEGRDFHVLTDHKPLIYALSCRPERHSSRQVLHLDFISQFTTDLRHVHGSDYPAADALSHLGTNALYIEQPSPVIDFWELAMAQVNNPDLAKLRTDSSLRLESVPLALSDGLSTICDVSTST